MAKNCDETKEERARRLKQKRKRRQRDNRDSMNYFSVHFAILLTLHHIYCCTWPTVTKALATPTNSNAHMSPVGSKVMRCTHEAYIHYKYVHLVICMYVLVARLNCSSVD